MPDDDVVSPRLEVERLDVGIGLRRLACHAIKRAITEMDIYGQPSEIRLDERQLSEDLGVSRTPIRDGADQGAPPRQAGGLFEFLMYGGG